jgi:DNA-nicking Smr family endonuclease
MEPVHIPIEDTLDLHTFRPSEVRSLLDEYFSECIRVGLFSIRVIHGKGRGVLKKTVHRILAKNPKVESFLEAPPEAGGWGATLVELKKDIPLDSAKP